MEIKEKIIENLKHVYDPEISINVYDLGLIYDVAVDNKQCNITMSLTSAFCPAADDIVADVEMATMRAGIEDVNVNITFDPPWGPEHMSEDARMILGIWE